MGYEEFAKSLTTEQREFLETCYKEKLAKTEKILKIYKIVKKEHHQAHNEKLTWMTYNMKEMMSQAEVYWKLVHGKEDKRYEDLWEYITELWKGRNECLEETKMEENVILEPQL